jgi:hypothetical protein
LAGSPGGGCCRIACDAPNLAHGRRDKAPCMEWYLCGGRLKLRKNTLAIYFTQNIEQ